MPTAPSRGKILGVTAIAAGVATIILIAVVLPAEYGIDPLRTGAAMGLTAMAKPSGASPSASPAASSAPAPGSRGLKQDVYEVELRPFEGVEYKYRMEKGTTMVYSWAATDAVEFEFHGEPDGAPKKYFDSYEKSSGRESQGTFAAPTSGIHGWYWANPGATRIKVRLTTSGFYGDATEFRDGDRTVHHITIR